MMYGDAGSTPATSTILPCPLTGTCDRASQEQAYKHNEYMKTYLKNSIRIICVVFSLALLAGCATKTAYFKLDPSLSADFKSFEGFQYVPLTRICDVYGLSCKWDTFVRTATISKKSDTIVLRAGSDRILVNGVWKKINRPVVFSGGAVFVPVTFVKADLGPVIGRVTAVPAWKPAEVTPVEKKFSIRTIVLDTGHGGKDAGAVGRAYGTKEKDVALTLSKKVKAILEDNGIRVIMTRSDDTFISLERRVDIANRSGADLFASIHINASRSRLMRGFECYYLSNATDDNARALVAFEDASLKLSDDASAEHSKQLDKTLWDMTLTENRMESGELASYICESVDDSGVPIRNKGVRTARFYVLKNNRLPAVLIETGYISNRYEEAKLRDPAVLNKMANAIARGILKYKDRYEKTEGFTDI